MAFREEFNLFFQPQNPPTEWDEMCKNHDLDIGRSSLSLCLNNDWNNNEFFINQSANETERNKNHKNMQKCVAGRNF